MIVVPVVPSVSIVVSVRCFGDSGTNITCNTNSNIIELNKLT